MDYSVSLTIVSGKITRASFVNFTVSGNGKYTREQGDVILQKLVNTASTRVDTVSGATGTSQAIQDAIDDALSRAISPVTPAVTTVVATPPVTPNTHKNIPTQKTSLTDLESYITPNTKEYTLHRLATGKYIFERPDGIFSLQKFSTRQEVIDFLDAHNQYQDVAAYTAPNGRTYMILKNPEAEKYTFRRADGSVSTRSFVSQREVSVFLRDNNPLVKPAVIKTKKKPLSAVVKKTSTPVSVAPVVAPTKPVAPVVKTVTKPVVPAVVTAPVVKPAPAVVVTTPKPAPVATPAPTRAVNTTTKVS